MMDPAFDSNLKYTKHLKKRCGTKTSQRKPICLRNEPVCKRPMELD